MFEELNRHANVSIRRDAQWHARSLIGPMLSYPSLRLGLLRYCVNYLSAQVYYLIYVCPFEWV